MASNTKLNFQRTFTNLIKLESKKIYTLSYSDLILPVELTSINFDITSKESLYQISLNDDGIYINTSNMISFFIVSFFNSDIPYGLTIQSQQTSFANMDIYSSGNFGIGNCIRSLYLDPSMGTSDKGSMWALAGTIQIIIYF